MDKESDFVSSQRRYTRRQETHENIVNIISHQGNANRNYNERTFHTTRMPTTKKSDNKKCS